jgi:hypothetical protein
LLYGHDELTSCSILNFFPVVFTSVYEPDPVRIGLRAIGPAFTTAIGAILFNAALSVFPGRAREVLLVAVLLMTCFAGSLAVMTPDNEHLVVGLGAMASLGVGGVLVPAATVALSVSVPLVVVSATRSTTTFSRPSLSRTCQSMLQSMPSRRVCPLQVQWISSPSS